MKLKVDNNRSLEYIQDKNATYDLKIDKPERERRITTMRLEALEETSTKKTGDFTEALCSLESEFKATSRKFEDTENGLRTVMNERDVSVEEARGLRGVLKVEEGSRLDACRDVEVLEGFA